MAGPFHAGSRHFYTFGMADPNVLRALEAAVERAPDDLALRTHLAGLLAEAADGRVAGLEHARYVLAAEPANHTALDIARRCAEATGQTDIAAGYAQLLRALGAAPAEAVPVGARDEPTDPELAAEIDAFVLNTLSDGVDVDTPELTLDDVGGLTEVKDQLRRSFIAPMRNPELRALYGKSLRGGLLLYGPPGCGKTFLASAVAGELRARFYALGLQDMLDMWLGSSEKNLHEAFETARRNAPCVLFIDEIDALGMKRTNLGRSAARNVVVQLLTELDGVGTDNDGVYVIGATNAPWDVDPALRRPGRFDRTLLVLPPDRPAREAILSLHLRGRPVEGIDVATIAAATEGFSGADLRLVCETAAEGALDDSIRTGTVRPIRMADVRDAAAATTPSTGPWFEVAANFVTFANATGEYDDLASYMKRRHLL
jgi:SpoVK/Ycf46/Vps4 family AAA+-type ATPase